ncbi:MAG: Lrp/AsnC family transcriptional regulator [Candidatus Hermodarchaeia archaeon]
MELDAIDHQILTILKQNARTPFTHIAKLCNVSDATIHSRVQKMETHGYIKQYSLMLNEAMLGKPVTAFILIRVDPSTVEAVCQQLINVDDVDEVYEIHERYDVLVKVKGKNLDAVRDVLVQKIRSIPNIAGSEAYTIYKTWKKTHP